MSWDFGVHLAPDHIASLCTLGSDCPKSLSFVSQIVFASKPCICACGYLQAILCYPYDVDINLDVFSEGLGP